MDIVKNLSAIFISGQTGMSHVSENKRLYSGFDIYSTVVDGKPELVQVSEPLHQSILRNLTAKDMSSSEISEATGKAQSTLSVHLDTLVSRGLIRSQYDVNDSRRKIFSLSSVKVAYSMEASKEGIDRFQDMVAETANSPPPEFYKTLLRTLLVECEAYGMHIGPALERMGELLAVKLAPKIPPGKLEDVISFVQDFYERNGLGEVCIYTFLPLTIIIRDTEAYPFKIESISMFSHGLFRKVLSETMGRQYAIVRREIFGADNNYYKFIIELKE